MTSVKQLFHNYTFLEFSAHMKKQLGNLNNPANARAVLKILATIALETIPNAEDQRGQIIKLLQKQNIDAAKFDFKKDRTHIEIRPSGTTNKGKSDRILISVDDGTIKVVEVGDASIL